MSMNEFHRQGITTNFKEMFRYFLSNEPSTSLGPSEDVLYSTSSINSLYFNLLFDAKFTTVDMEQRVKELVSLYQKKGKLWMWVVPKDSSDDGLIPYLEQHGLSKIGHLAGMAMDLDVLPEKQVLSDQFSITKVQTEEDLKTFFEVAKPANPLTDDDVEGFFTAFRNIGFSDEAPLQSYIGWYDGNPVSTSSVYYGNGIAGIYCVSTLSEYRGKGFGAAITAYPLYEARQKGYKSTILHATDMGHPVYKKIGFEDYFKMELWSPVS